MSSSLSTQVWLEFGGFLSGDIEEGSNSFTQVLQEFEVAPYQEYMVNSTAQTEL